MPLIRMATLGSNPIRMGASTVAPNIAITCCTPMAAVCGHASLSSGAITPPWRKTSEDFSVQSNIPISGSLLVWRDAMGIDGGLQMPADSYAGPGVLLTRAVPAGLSIEFGSLCPSFSGNNMKQQLILAAAALLCTASFAQAPPGVVARPSQEANPTASPAASPAAKAEMKVDAKKGAMPMGAMPMGAGGTMPMGAGASNSGTAAMGMKAMDTNGDGMISKKEWDAYHSSMWSRMKSKKGMMPMADVEAMMKGGPN